MLSTNQLLAAKILKRADALKIRYEDLQIEQGFNGRIEGEDLNESIALLEKHIRAGGVIPPLYVRFDTEGRAFVVDGHRRHAAIGAARAAGYEYEWVEVKRLEGSKADCIAAIITTAEGRPLTPIEQAGLIKRLQAEGLSNAEIAEKTNFTVARIEQFLKLANAPTGVKEMVKQGKVSAAVATEAVRQHGDSAWLVLQQEEANAKAQGKTKVTAGTIAKAKAYKPTVADYEQAAKALFDSLTPYEKEALTGEVDKARPATRQAMVALFKMAGVDYLTKQIKEYATCESVN